MEQTEKPQDAPPPAPRKSFRTAIKEWAAIRFKEVKPWFEWLYGWVREKKAPLKEARGLLAVLALLIIGTTVWATHKRERGIFDRRLDATNSLLRASFASSNSFLHGEAREKDREIGRLGNIVESNNREIAKLTADVGRLTTEKEGLQVRNSMLEALPATAAGMYSSTTNLLSSLGGIPEFSLRINGEPVTNGATVSMKGRSVEIGLRNTSEIAADQVGVSLYLPVEFGSTNLVAEGWHQNIPLMKEFRDSRDGKLISRTPIADQWVWSADSPVAPGFGRAVEPVIISTNFAGKRLGATIYIYSARSRRHEFKVALVFE